MSGSLKTVAGVAVAAILLVGVAVPLFALRGPESRSASQTGGAGASSGNPRITGQLVANTTKLDPGIRVLTVAFGDVWVVNYTSLTRIDGATGNTEATIPIESEDQASVAAVGGFVWVSEGRGDGPQTISAVDPATNSVAGAVTVPAPVFGLAVYQGELWASISPSGVGGSLVQIDPASMRVGKELPVGLNGSVSVAGSSLWIHDTSYGGISLQVDPATGAIGMKLEGTIGDVVFADGLYWSIFTDWSSEDTTSVNAIDPATGKTVATLAVPRAADLAASSAGLWVSGAPGYLSDDSIDPNEPATAGLMDPATQAFVAGPVPIDTGGPGFAAGENALWFADYESGNVTKVTFVPDAALSSSSRSRR